MTFIFSLFFCLQFLDIHEEKVYRRKIGSLTMSKKFPRTEKIVYGEHKGPQSTYARNPINFSSLDNTGHGIMVRPLLPLNASPLYKA